MQLMSRPQGMRRIPIESLEARVLFAATTSALGGGTLDFSFGLGGRVLNSTLPPAVDVAVDSADRPIVVGTLHGDVFIARYTAAGTPDLTFGAGNGFVLSDFGGDEQVGGVAIQPDGKIVITAAETIVPGDTELLIARYLPSGALDLTFGGNSALAGAGAALSDGGLRKFGLDEIPNAVVIAGDGHIVVGGEVRNQLTGATTGMVARLTAAGNFDTGFGNGQGFAIFGGGASHVRDVAVDASGRVIAVGDGAPASTAADISSFLVTRLTAGGAVDTSFSPGTLPLAAGGTFNGVAIQADGRILAAGGDNAGDAVIARYKTEGTLDSTFGQSASGFTRGTFDPGNSTAVFNDVKVQSGGRIVAGGSAFRASEGRNVFLVTRFTSDGLIDPTFGNAGAAIPPLPSTNTISRIALTHGGDIVAAGTTGSPTLGGGLALARFLGDDNVVTTTTLTSSHKRRTRHARHRAV
jgi:uncharacterized delta-60 repeat protein